jgi:hypothetical protein
MKRPMIIMGTIVVILLLAGAAFYGGMNVGKAQAQSDQNAFFASRGFNPNGQGAAGTGGAGGTGGTGAAGGFTGGAGGNGARAGARGAVGSITKVDGNTLTVTTAQGDTITVNIADNTPIEKQAAGTKSDLKVGTQILVTGQRSGNNVSATAIQIANGTNGFGGFFGGGGGARRNGTPVATPGN